ncbi:hypothetical protein BDD21_3871 [Thiocapsa rosea]|uniref:Uncharacterized protein n=1 Tax=Thiocapsa rosea TaxID=69360 RepID=A0A495VAD7_9GAMM|nr:hypothetical protein BDD21_3871 [Thiocapsa rosea]
MRVRPARRPGEGGATWRHLPTPETQITIFEAYSHHCRYRVETPRIPRLTYPAWDEL